MLEAVSRDVHRVDRGESAGDPGLGSLDGPGGDQAVGTWTVLRYLEYWGYGYRDGYDVFILTILVIILLYCSVYPICRLLTILFILLIFN